MRCDINSATPVRTRQSHPEDAAFLSALFAANCTHLHALGLPTAALDAMVVQQYAFRQADYHRRFPSAKTLIALVDETPVGQMMVHDDGTVLHIVDVAVAPSLRGRGYGAALVRQVQTQAGRDRRQGVTLSVDPENRRALRLYLALGFETVETHPVQWHMAWRPGTSAVREAAYTAPLSIFPTTKG
ncbi:MAG: GNAT family N-acetyltransferase [Acidovorax sp.]|nr:GNAT family N-acetyltransferase [Acidovorax sp.]